MFDRSIYQLLADVVLSLHIAVVLFVVGGLVFVIVGNMFFRWQWVNALWFRFVHLGAILFVIAETWLNFTCPLTTLEMWLRKNAHATTYNGSFIEYWFQRILYYDAPTWVFLTIYTLFGVLVLAAWWRFPPNR